MADSRRSGYDSRLLPACGIQIREATTRRQRDLKQLEDHEALVDLIGEGAQVRMVRVPEAVVRHSGWMAGNGDLEGFSPVTRTFAPAV